MENIHENLLKEIQKAIQNTKFENHVFAVGGTVRDILLNRQVKDIDLCVDIPNGHIEFAEYICKEYNCFLKNSNPCVFENYSTCSFFIKTINEFASIPIECSQTRKSQEKNKGTDMYSVFGTIEEDSKYRDITINSIYLNISSGQIIDPQNGVSDIDNKLIRASDAKASFFTYDPIKMLRIIRMASDLEWGIEKNTWFYILAHSSLIENAPVETILRELNRILLLPKPSKALKRLKASGLLQKILPEVYDLVGLEQGKKHNDDAFEHTLNVVDNVNNDLLSRWGALLHDIGKPKALSFENNEPHFFRHEHIGSQLAIKILGRLKMPKRNIQIISDVVKYHMYFKHYGDKLPSNKIVKRFYSKLSSQLQENIDVILNVIDADNISASHDFCMPNQIKLIREQLKKITTNNKIKLPITGKDILQEFNLTSSPLVGHYLQLVTEYIENNPSATKSDCIEYIRKKLTI